MNRLKKDSQSTVPILAFAPGDWRWPSIPGSTRYYLWTLAERGWPVVYVEPPKTFRLKTETWTADDRPFTVLRPALVPMFGVSGIPAKMAAEPLRKLTSTCMRNAALQLCKTLRMEPKIFWLGAPWHSSLVSLKDVDKLVVHHNYDELSKSPILKPFQASLLSKWEAELNSRCDLILCSSLPQLENRKEFFGKTVLLENALKDGFLDEELLAEQRDEFNDLIKKFQALPRPRIVYGGVLDDRLDEQLLLKIRTSFPQASLVFLGNLSGPVSSDLKSLVEQENVHVFGRVPHDAYPHLYAEADVLIYPFKQTPFTSGMFPDKLGEYLASGKPVVSVASSEVVRLSKESRGGVIRIGENAEEFCHQLKAALKEESDVFPAMRRGLASKRTWANQTTKLERVLREALIKKGISGSPKAP